MFLIVANRGESLISIFLETRNLRRREKNFRFLFDSRDIFDNRWKCTRVLRAITDYSTRIIWDTYHPAKKEKIVRPSVFIARYNNCMQMGAQVEREVR